MYTREGVERAQFSTRRLVTGDFVSRIHSGMVVLGSTQCIDIKCRLQKGVVCADWHNRWCNPVFLKTTRNYQALCNRELLP